MQATKFSRLPSYFRFCISCLFGLPNSVLDEYLFSCIEEKARPKTTRYEGESSTFASIFFDYVSELKVTSFIEKRKGEGIIIIRTILITRSHSACFVHTHDPGDNKSKSRLRIVQLFFGASLVLVTSLHLSYSHRIGRWCIILIYRKKGQTRNYGIRDTKAKPEITGYEGVLCIVSELILTHALRCTSKIIGRSGKREEERILSMLTVLIACVYNYRIAVCMICTRTHAILEETYTL